MPFTQGFDPAFLDDHFDQHGDDFGATTSEEYEARADMFLGGPKEPATYECTRKNGDVLRFDIYTEEFGVLRKDGVILSYYIPDPLWHRQPSNLDYFWQQCQR